MAKMKLKCRNHPDVDTDFCCFNCGKAYCIQCLTRMENALCCENCKEGNAKSCEPLHRKSGTCKEAQYAVFCSVISVFYLGYILAPMAFLLALWAKKQLKTYPQMKGAFEANMAIVVSVFSMLYTILCELLFLVLP